MYIKKKQKCTRRNKNVHKNKENVLKEETKMYLKKMYLKKKLKCT